MLRTGFTILTFAIVLILASAGSSQEKDKKPKGMLPQGWKDLNLSAEQKAKVYTIQSDYKAKTQKLEDEIKALKIQERQEMLKVLTAEQKSQLAKSVLGEGPKKEESKKDDKK